MRRFLSIAGLAGVMACSGYAADVVLKADGNDGRDNCWTKRYTAGVNSWGIQGTGSSLQGTIWFNSFPGATGSYKVQLGAVLESDGRPEYRVSAGTKALASGSYPYPGCGQTCDKAKGCEETKYIDCGTHTITRGDKITVWGKSVYPCGSSHGAYTRWYELRFTPLSTQPQPPSISLSPASLSFAVDAGYSSLPAGKSVNATNGGDGTLPGLTAAHGVDWLKVTVGGGGNSQTLTNEIVKTGLAANTYTATVTVKGSGVADATYRVTFTVRAVSSGTPTEFVSPSTGTQLEEGATVTLSAKGDNVVWSYDANSDGLGRTEIGAGATVSFTVPDNVKDPRTIAIYASGDNGEVSRTFSIIDAPPRQFVTLLAPNGGETYTVGETMVVRWEADTNVVTDVDILLSIDNGRNWEKLNTASSVSVGNKDLWGHFAYVIPAGSESDQCLVRVEKYESTDPAQIDRSEAPFSIGPLSVGVRGSRVPPYRAGLSVRETEVGVVRIEVASPGAHRVTVLDARGAVVAAFAGAGPAVHQVRSATMPGGLYLARAETGAGSVLAAMFLMR